MGIYSQYGLDENKQAKDNDGPAGGGYCLWCDTIEQKRSTGRGFSMCFVHFMICKECVEIGLVAKDQCPDRWIQEECFKCGKKKFMDT